MVQIRQNLDGSYKFTDDTGRPISQKEGLKQIRLKLMCSPAYLGQILGVSGRTVEGWEQGSPINTPALIILAIVFGVDDPVVY